MGTTCFVRCLVFRNRDDTTGGVPNIHKDSISHLIRYVKVTIMWYGHYINALRHKPSHTMQKFVPGKPFEFSVLYDDVVKMG